MSVGINQKQVLYIIGASGMLGKAIKQHFFHPHWNVVAGRARTRGGDISEIKNELAALKTKNPTSRISIINCAWSPKPTAANRLHPENEIWIQITRELVEHCLKMRYAYFGIGTCLERDFTIQDPYTSAKRACAKIVLTALSDTLENKTFTEKGPISIGWLRPYYIYSLNPLTPSLVRYVAGQLNNLSLTKETNNPVQIETNDSHDYIELESCVDLIQKIILSGVSGVFDLGTGQLESNISLIARLFPGVSVSSRGHDSSIAGTSLTANMEWNI